MQKVLFTSARNLPSWNARVTDTINSTTKNDPPLRPRPKQFQTTVFGSLSGTRKSQQKSDTVISNWSGRYTANFRGALTPPGLFIRRPPPAVPPLSLSHPSVSIGKLSLIKVCLAMKTSLSCVHYCNECIPCFMQSTR